MEAILLHREPGRKSMFVDMKSIITSEKNRCDDNIIKTFYFLSKVQEYDFIFY